MAPVDQNAAPQPPTKPNRPDATQTPNSNPLSTPAVIQTGEIMLIISLVIILLVVLTVSFHFYLKRQKRRYRKEKPKKKVEDPKEDHPELHNEEKEMSELPAIPLCEMGESEPRHEMEDAEVLERHTIPEPEHPHDSPVYVSPLTPANNAGPMFGEMTTRGSAQPPAGVYAAYLMR